MASITIDLSDSQLQKLQYLARAQGIPLETLIQASIEDCLTTPKRDFSEAAEYVLRKNSELYRRLA